MADAYALISERAFTQQVIDLARWYKWRVAHFRPARTKNGKWVTPMSGDVGYPDLTLARDGVVIHAELKAAHGRVTAPQQKWLIALGGVVWRPADIDRIEQILGGKNGSSGIV